jgi:hypothetical protein
MKQENLKWVFLILVDVLTFIWAFWHFYNAIEAYGTASNPQNAAGVIHLLRMDGYDGLRFSVDRTRYNLTRSPVHELRFLHGLFLSLACMMAQSIELATSPVNKDKPRFLPRLVLYCSAGWRR